MTHFVTLEYLRYFAPWLALWLAAIVGRYPRLFLGASIALALYGCLHTPEELFSRQLACNRLALLATTAIAALRWRDLERRELLITCALALLAAGNDVLTLALLATLVAVCNEGGWAKLAAFPLLAGAGVLAASGETELALTLRSAPVTTFVFLGICGASAMTQRRTSIISIALFLRAIAVLFAPPGNTWVLQ